MLGAIGLEEYGGAAAARPADIRMGSVGVDALPSLLKRLAPREREIAEIVHKRAEVTAEEIRAAMTPPISNSAVRTMLTRLIAKGVIRKRKIGKRFVYLPARPCEQMREEAFQRLTQDYFEGSLRDAAVALLAFIDQREPGATRDIGRHLMDGDPDKGLRVHG